jgi:hypothetical protein
MEKAMAKKDEFKEMVLSNYEPKQNIQEFEQFHKNDPLHMKYIGVPVLKYSPFDKEFNSDNYSENELFFTYTDATLPIYVGIPLADTYLNSEAYEEGNLQFKVGTSMHDLKIFDRQKVVVKGYDNEPFVSFDLLPTEEYISTISYEPAGTNEEYHRVRTTLINLIQAGTPANKKVKLGEYEYQGTADNLLYMKFYVVDYTLDKANLGSRTDRYALGIMKVEVEDMQPLINLFHKLREKELESNELSKKTKSLPNYEAALAKRFKNEYGPEGWVATEIRVTGSQYSIQKNNLGVPIRKLIKMEVAAKHSSEGRCKVFQFEYGPAFSGGGSYDGEFNGATIGGWDIQCSKIE